MASYWPSYRSSHRAVLNWITHTLGNAVVALLDYLVRQKETSGSPFKLSFAFGGEFHPSGQLVENLEGEPKVIDFLGGVTLSLSISHLLDLRGRNGNGFS